MAKLFLFIKIGGLGGFWFRIALGSATTSTETNRNVDAKMLKVTVDLRGAIRKVLSLRAALKKTTGNCISM